MKQLSFLDTSVRDNKSSNTTQKIHHWNLFIDGASRNNPGKSGAGVYITKDQMVVCKKGYYLGEKTNNQAEYLALLIGLYHCKKLHVQTYDLLSVYSDSQLMVSQLNGVYKIKNTALKQYFTLAQKELKQYNYALNHILRHKNTDADALANSGIDKKIALPSSFIQIMQTYDIVI